MRAKQITIGQIPDSLMIYNFLLQESFDRQGISSDSLLQAYISEGKAVKDHPPSTGINLAYAQRNERLLLLDLYGIFAHKHVTISFDVDN